MIKMFALLLTLLFSGCALKESPISATPITHKPIVPKTTVPAQVHAQPQILSHTPVSYQPRPRKTVSHSQVKSMHFKTLRGKTIQMQAQDNILRITSPEYRNKDVVLYLFGRDCVHCRHEVDQIRQLAKNPHLKIIGIHAQKMIGNRALKTYAQNVGYHFDILSFDNDVQLLKYLDKSGIWEGGTPSHLLVDRHGNVEELSIPMLLRR